jgi:hypothetical protein
MPQRSLLGMAFALLAAALAITPRSALAQDAQEEERPPPGAGTPREAAPDWRRGAVLLSVGGGYLAPLGSVATGLFVGNRVSGGPSASASLGFGLSRSTSFELQGAYGRFFGASACPGCSGDTIAAGLGFTYHLAQGIAMDPWGSFGVGYRTSLITVPADTTGLPGSGRYHGFDFARVALGGDFYPHPVLGIGPYIEAAFGSYRIRPVENTPSVYAFVQVGLRVVLDPLRGGRVKPQPMTARAY